MALSADEIKQKLGWGGVTRLARATGTTKGHVSQVINRKRRDRKVEVAAARRVGVRVDELFPADHLQQVERVA